MVLTDASGLPVVRYDAESLGERLGPRFEWVDIREREHRFQWAVFSGSSLVGFADVIGNARLLACFDQGLLKEL
ncbi:MAG TPA: hypothetical protein VHG30_06030 [Microvirga sp.]|nr:hypothetical protein [Microvirga sp.]